MQPYPNPNYFMQYQQPQYQQPNPYMQRMEQLQQFQQTLQTPVQNQQMPTLGKIVESIDIVKATDIPMDGNMYYFPKADGTEIYGKAWMQDGRTRILTFKPVLEDEPNNCKRQVLSSKKWQLISSIFWQLSTSILFTPTDCSVGIFY